MPVKTLLALPIEVLQLISEYLDSRGLSGLSTASKYCRAAASNTLFRNINFCFVGTEKLESDLCRWTEVLDSNTSWKAVKRMYIHAEIDTPPELRISHLGDDPLEPWRYYADVTPTEQTFEHDGEFVKLAAFIARLPALTDLIWACHDQLPPCVLSVLEDESRHQRARLHLRTFRLRSLLPPPGFPIEVHPYDKRLARSPMLHSLALRYSSYDSTGNSDFNLESVMAMTASLAPNLKELFLCHNWPAYCPALLAAWKSPRQDWQGDELGEVELSGNGSITRLVLCGRSDMVDVKIWTQKTDFTKLRALKLYQTVSTDLLRWLANHHPFSEALEELALDLDKDCSDDIVESFFDSLPPLRTLRLGGFDIERAPEAIFRHHGGSLHTLLLEEPIADVKALNFQTACPNLRELALSITRSGGNEQETASYHAIGNLPHLRHLTLTLYVRKLSTAPDTAAVIRAALVDSAIDETLAATIFHTISASSPRGSLETIRLSVKVDVESLDSDTVEACNMIARSWHCEKDHRDDAPGHSCIVTEMGREEREEDEEDFDGKVNAEIEHVVRDLWPEQATGDWRHDWHSWPLQNDIV